MNMPRITIITPSFNQAKYLEQTILSIINQDYPLCEYIIVDGGSTDGSVDIIRKYSSKLAYWVSEADRGQSHAIAKGIQKSTGEWINWINSDDALLPGALKRVAEASQENSLCDIIIGTGIIGDKCGQFLNASIPTSPRMWSAKNSILSPFCQQATFWTREAYESVGGLNEDLFFRMDIDLLERMLLAGAKAVTIPNHLSFFRSYEETKSGQNQDIRQEEFDDKLKQNGVSKLQRALALNIYRMYRLFSGNYIRNRVSRFALRGQRLSAVWEDALA